LPPEGRQLKVKDNMDWAVRKLRELRRAEK